MAHCMDAGRTHFIGQRGEHLRCITPAQHDARTMRPQAARQTIERVMQPDPARPAIGMVPGPIVIQNIDRDDRTGLGGGVESGLIGQTQVAPKPHNLNRTHACGTLITARLFLTA